MPTEELLQAFEVGRDQYVITGLAYRGRLDLDTNTFRMQVAAVGSQVWNDWLTVDAAGNVTIPSAIITGSVAWASITGTPTTLAGYGITSPLDVPQGGIGVGTLAANGVLYGNGAAAVQALAVNATATKKFLTQTSSAAPAWDTIAVADVPTLNQNTTGSAATLSPGRTINGVAFDGSVNITVTAAAGTLTGATLNATVTASSLTSVGTIGTGVWQGTAVALGYGGTGADLSTIAKGGLIVGTAAATVGIKAVGTDGQVLTADAASAGGVKWSAAGTGTVTGSGTAGTIPKWSSASALTNSLISESGSVLTQAASNPIFVLGPTNNGGFGQIKVLGTSANRDAAFYLSNYDTGSMFFRVSTVADGPAVALTIANTGAATFASTIGWGGGSAISSSDNVVLKNAANIVSGTIRFTGAAPSHQASSAMIDDSAGTSRWWSWGPDNVTLGAFSWQTRTADGSSGSGIMSLSGAGLLSLSSAMQISPTGGNLGGAYLQSYNGSYQPLELIGSQFGLYLGSTKAWGVNTAGDLTVGASSHLALSVGTPALSASTDFRTGSVAGTDYAFTITVGSVGAASAACTGTINFGHTFSSVPTVVVTTTYGSGDTYVLISAVSTTAVTFAKNAAGTGFNAGEKIFVQVLGY